MVITSIFLDSHRNFKLFTSLARLFEIYGHPMVTNISFLWQKKKQSFIIGVEIASSEISFD